MAFAKGKSCAVIELDILREALVNMINSVETRFQNILDSLKARIFDIEHDRSIPNEEKECQINPFYDEVENYTSQLYHARNKLVICIYSICEATLASICTDYKIAVVHETKGNNKKTFISRITFTLSIKNIRKSLQIHIL